MRLLVLLVCVAAAFCGYPDSPQYEYSKEAREGSEEPLPRAPAVSWPSVQSEEESDSLPFDGEVASRSGDEKESKEEEVATEADEEENETIKEEDDEDEKNVDPEEAEVTEDDEEKDSTKMEFFKRVMRMGGFKRPLRRRHHHRRPGPRRSVGCHHHHCRPESPRYKVVKEYRGYELRCYPPYLWASTPNDELDGKYFSTMFKRLFAYIQGANSEKKKIPMTTPVMVGMKYNITDHKTKSGMRFWLSRRGMCRRCGPPKPTDPKVTIRKTPTFCAYVRTFGGWVMSRSYSYYKQLWYLSQDLKRDGKDDYYWKGFSVFAGYNSPWELFHRRNEVMRIVRCKKCSNDGSAFIKMMEETQDEAFQVNDDDTASF